MLKPLGLLGHPPINVLWVRGIAGVSLETAWFNSGSADLAACAGTKVVGQVWGDWSLPTVKTEVLKFLATYPGKIDLVMQNGIMGAGVIQAFQEAGRPVPLMTESNANAGDLSWWYLHRSTYKTAGAAGPNGYQADNAAVRVLFRILGGDGLKLRDMELPAPAVTNANLKAFLYPGATLNSDQESHGPINLWGGNAQLNGYFTKPGTPGGI